MLDESKITFDICRYLAIVPNFTTLSFRNLPTLPRVPSLRQDDIPSMTVLSSDFSLFTGYAEDMHEVNEYVKASQHPRVPENTKKVL